MSPITQKGQIMSLHKLATIGIVKSFGEEREWFGYRRDMTPSSLKFLVADFVRVLEEFQTEMVSRLPQSVVDGFKAYKEKRKSMPKNEPLESKRFFMKKFNFLQQLMTLPAYSWNGQRYDVQVLLGPLIDAFSHQPKKFKYMNVIKRGTSFMEIKFGFLVLRDFINFSNPMKLGEYF